MQQVKCTNWKLWEFNKPVKVKGFSWLILKISILIKDNLLKRGWKGKKRNASSVMLMNQLNFFFLNCPLAIFVWTVVNRAFILGPTCR